MKSFIEGPLMYLDLPLDMAGIKYSVLRLDVVSFMRNPVLLWNFDDKDPIGEVTNISSDGYLLSAEAVVSHPMRFMGLTIPLYFATLYKYEEPIEFHDTTFITRATLFGISLCDQNVDPAIGRVVCTETVWE